VEGAVYGSDSDEGTATLETRKSIYVLVNVYLLYHIERYGPTLVS
jgi:hypothetical protein